MNQLHLYLDADVPVQEPSSDSATTVVIGDSNTHEPARREEVDGILLSLI